MVEVWCWRLPNGELSPLHVWAAWWMAEKEFAEYRQAGGGIGYDVVRCKLVEDREDG